jgi:exopolysaccharide production protein ExoZ
VTAPAVVDPLPAQNLGGKPGTYLHGLDLLRVVASTLVIYTHVAAWFSTRGHVWGFAAWVDDNVIGPLRLNPGLSFAGVATFLVVSGLVVTHVADRETPAQFFRRRLARILPLLVVITALAWLMINLGLRLEENGQRSLSVLDLVKGITLAGFFTAPQVVILPVAWTLLVQIAFYGYITATIPLLRRYPWIAPAAAAALVCVVLSWATGAPEAGIIRLGIIAAYLPVLCIGQVISLVRAGKIHGAAGGALGAVHFLLFVWADHMGNYTHTGTAHPRTLLLVVCGVLLGITVAGRLSRCALVKNWSSRTYAIYLLHPLCIYPILDMLVPRLGLLVSLLLALTLLGVLAEIFHRFLEMPVYRWFRGRERKRALR